MKGVVYTEIVVHAAPSKLLAEAPYQVAIVELPSGERITGRVDGDRARIGDEVEVLDPRDGVSLFRRISR